MLDPATSPVRLLGAFVDTLVLNVYPTNAAFQQEKRRLSSELQEELSLWKEQAQEAEEDIPTRFTFRDLPLVMTRKGDHGFQWILKNSKLSLAINRGSKMALLAQVRCSSEYLWSVRELGAIIHEVHTSLMPIFGETILVQPSALDLAADVVGLDLGGLPIHNIKEHFISRAQLTDEHPLSQDAMIDGPDSIKRRWGRLTGLPFGARAGAVSGIIYDKLHEITYKSPEKAWFKDLWLSVKDDAGTPLWDGESPVWRIEMRFRRPALNEMTTQDRVFHGIDDAYTLDAFLPGLWSYAVGHADGGLDTLPDGWLRYVIPTTDTNRSRWPVHPDWAVIQSAFQLPAVVEQVEDLALAADPDREELLRLVDAELTAHPFASTAPDLAPASSSPFVLPVKPAPAAPPASSPDPASESPLLPAPALPLPFDLVPFIRRRKRRKNLDQMIAQIAGCVITAEAWRPDPDRSRLAADSSPDLSYTFHFLFEEVEDYLARKRREFSHDVQKKRDLYPVESAPRVAA